MNEIQVTNNQIQKTGGNEMYLDVAMFEQCQRVAKMFATSTMVPAHFQNNIGNCMIALNFAARTNLDPFVIMQSMYIVHGKPGFEAKLAIALLNKSRLFTALKFTLSGEGKTRSCTATATRISTGDECSQTVTWAMVEAEGWSKNSKWKTMPDLMFQYRSASFFIKVHAPEVLLGMQTREELEDIQQSRQATTRVISSANDAFRAIPDKTAPLDVETPEPNPLHVTEAWKKYEQAKDINPVFAATIPEPINEEQCISAAKAISLDIDQNI